MKIRKKLFSIYTISKACGYWKLRHKNLTRRKWRAVMKPVLFHYILTVGVYLLNNKFLKHVDNICGLEGTPPPHTKSILCNPMGNGCTQQDLVL
jgi:hypothetical protein